MELDEYIENDIENFNSKDTFETLSIIFKKDNELAKLIKSHELK
jgi:hypothetical protein